VSAAQSPRIAFEDFFMGSDIKAFGVNRLVAGAFFIVLVGVVSLVFLPGAVDWIAYSRLHSKLSIFNSWEPRHRLLLGLAFVGLAGLGALVYLRLLIDNRVVFIGNDGIEVRHPLGTQRALWRDFAAIRKNALVRGHFDLLFRAGTDSEGRKMNRKVRMPAPMLGVDLRGILVETTVHFAMKEMAAAGVRPPEAEARATFHDIGSRYINPPAAARTFGKRR
jgi:hypothetical protein